MATSNHALTSSERELLSLVLHDEAHVRVERPTPGQDNAIALVDGRWIVRTARTADARSYHANEVAVLAAMPARCRVPRPLGSLHHGIVYEYIVGSPLTAAKWRSLPDQHRRRIAADVRCVLDALHAIDPQTLPDDPELLDAEWVLTSIARCADVPPRAPLGFDPDGLATRFEHAWSQGAAPHSLVHVDLKPDNIVADDHRASVIDFGGVCLGDPAIDYGVLAHHFGNSMLEALGLDDSPIAARARCYADLYHLRRCTRGWTRSPRSTTAR